MRNGENAEWPLVLSRSLAMLLFLHVTFSLALVSASIGATYTYTELLPSGWVSAGARAINNSEAVVGSGSDVPDALKGFIYSGGTYIPLAAAGMDFMRKLTLSTATAL